jgi:hypothetical protein
MFEGGGAPRSNCVNVALETPSPEKLGTLPSDTSKTAVSLKDAKVGNSGGGARPGGTEGVDRRETWSRRAKPKGDALLGPKNGSSCEGGSEPNVVSVVSEVY